MDGPWSCAGRLDRKSATATFRGPLKQVTLAAVFGKRSTLYAATAGARMRGILFDADVLEAHSPAQRAQNNIRQVVNESFSTGCGRPAIAPERLLMASLIQIQFSVPSGRQPIKEIPYNPWVRWFVSLGIDNRIWL